MKNTIIAALLLVLSLAAVPALAAQQDIAQISAVTASREALRTAVNTQLAAVQSNFDEVYAVIDAGPVYVNTTAPADTKVVWIDTDQDNAIKVYISNTWTVVGSGGEGSYTLPTAAADTLGGVKVGSRLTITDGVLSADVQSTDISGKEDALGNPASSGYVLSSTDTGVRSWVAQATDTDTDTLGDMTCTEGQIAKMGSSGWECDADAVASAGTGDDLGDASAGDVVALFSGAGDYLKTDGTKGTPAGDNLGSATYSSVVGLWTTCTGYLKSDGTCDSGGGSIAYPGAGVPLSTGNAWGTSYTVGTAANNLVQLNASAQLPAVSADLLTITDTGSYFTTDTVGAALQKLGGAPELLFGTEFTATDGTGTVTLTLDNPVTVEAWSASGWSGDTQGATRGDIYAILHVGDTDDDGMADKLDLASAGFVKVNDSGVVSSVKEKEYIGWSVVNSDTATAVADGKLGAAIPAGMNGMNLTDVTCSVAALNAAASGATTAVIRRVRLGSRMGDDTSQFDLTFSTPNVTVTWDATGTDPGISTSTLAAGDEVDISGFATAANNGHFIVATVGANYITFANASGVENLDDVGVTITPIRHRDMTSTGLTIDYNEYTASDEVIDTSNDDLATGDNLYVDINAVTTAAQKGLHCTATFEAL